MWAVGQRGSHNKNKTDLLSTDDPIGSEIRKNQSEGPLGNLFVEVMKQKWDGSIR